MAKRRRYSADELITMSLASLQVVGKPLKLKFGKNHNRAIRVERILAAYAVADLSSAKSTRARKSPPAKDADISNSISAGADSASPLLGERKPAFENLTSAVRECVEAVGGDDAASVPADHGGERPGAGRPGGMTGEIAFYNSLPQQPHPAIKDALELLFKTWSTRANCPEILLTKDQAFELALPWTQAAEVLGIMRYLPAWLMVGITCIWTTWNLVSAKAEIARAAAARRKAVQVEQPATV